MIEYNKYSREDLLILLGILDPMPYLAVRHLALDCKVACKQCDKEVAETFFNYTLHSHATTRDQLWLLYHEPIDNVPLYVNDKDPTVTAIAKWRLRIAK